METATARAFQHLSNRHQKRKFLDELSLVFEHLNDHVFSAVSRDFAGIHLQVQLMISQNWATTSITADALMFRRNWRKRFYCSLLTQTSFVANCSGSYLQGQNNQWSFTISRMWPAKEQIITGWNQTAWPPEDFSLCYHMKVHLIKFDSLIDQAKKRYWCWNHRCEVKPRQICSVLYRIQQLSLQQKPYPIVCPNYLLTSTLFTKMLNGEETLNCLTLLNHTH
jgi:hypothetical protein